MKLDESKTIHARDASASETVESELCSDLELAPPNPADIYRYLGYPQGASPGALIAEHVTRMVHESIPFLTPRGAFSIYPVCERAKSSLRLGGVIIRGEIAGFMAGAQRIAVFLVTVGEEISRRSTGIRQAGDGFGSWVVDAFGSWAAEAAADALMQRLANHLHSGEALTLRYSPGYCGMQMQEQQNLFSLIDAGAVGVTLLPSLLMQPLKSISGLVGIGPEDAISDTRSACDRCPQIDCHMRR